LMTLAPYDKNNIKLPGLTHDSKSEMIQPAFGFSELRSAPATPFRPGIAHQIGGLVLLSLIVFGVISGLIIRTKSAESLRKDLIAKGESIARTISENIQQRNLLQDVQSLPAFLNEFTRIYGVAYVLVLDHNGDVFHHTLDGPPSELLADLAGSSESEREIRLGNAGRVIDIAAPLNKGFGGTVHVGMNMSAVDRSLENVPVIVWRIVLVSVLCAMSVAVIVYIQTIRPIRVLTESVRQIGQGVFSGKIPIQSPGEMGSLARSLEQMHADLQRYHQQLEAKTLECRLSREELERQNEEIKRAQAHMIRSEKFASMGQIAASVAHEISNPLAGILTYVKLMRRKIESGPDLQPTLDTYKQYLLTMEKETERCGQILKNLLDFAHSSEPNLQGIDIHRVIEDTLFLLHFKLMMSDVLVERDYGETPLISGDFGQLKQVFLNVILNAVEAMKGKERLLRIQTVFHRESKTVLVKIQDTGEGISEENIYKVFDPFFTTKPRGTGMGLAVVWAILDKHNADMNIDSKPGKGTMVTIQLAAVQEETQRSAHQEA
jgi:signal transduction histidine kinase